MKHKAGYVNILGKPNVGKSTLMNALIGEKLSIITSKAQTTRHRILGILNGDDFQMVISDLPGIIKPAYKMHQTMMQFVKTSLEDADVFIYMVEIGDKPEKQPEEYEKIKQLNVPVIILLNKLDITDHEIVEYERELWEADFPKAEIISFSAKFNWNLEKLMDFALKHLPESPPYFDKDAITDRPERFFVTEIIREKILLYYKQEIPYSTEVVCTYFMEDGEIIKIAAEIYVERASQKPILIGKNGEMIKKVGIEARKDLEEFFQKKIYLETFVKVADGWRNSDNMLRRFGYRDY
ncbi:MAG TPA: GTPase Era [Chitinophagales bacterium]|nr:GTPase Era [Chitinophagales bacterium]MCB9075810.1 GTPase Era [Chitinophagales bacterium]HMU98670.1 GTPase Era [Chitinophagales bacterium]HMV03121.1 GTPase Era [Chitinophagales bacterium]HMW94158.1 GTPase Era [Chitinophagales bacterium]